MRLFVAAYPPASEVAALDTAVGERSPSMRWVPPHQWHVTLVFCGEVAERVVPELAERLERAATRTDPFSLRLAGAGTFSRALWVGLDGDRAEVSRLADRCVAAVRRCGIEVEDRPFRPHLTLARARRGPVERDDVTRLSSYAGASWQVESFRLVRSHLGAQVRHETLREFALGAAHQA